MRGLNSSVCGSRASSVSNTKFSISLDTLSLLVSGFNCSGSLISCQTSQSPVTGLPGSLALVAGCDSATLTSVRSPQPNNQASVKTIGQKWERMDRAQFQELGGMTSSWVPVT